MKKLLLIAAVLAVPAYAGDLYVSGAFGVHDADYDNCVKVYCDAAPGFGTTMGKFAMGYEWRNGLYVEGEHISGLQDNDVGLNAMWFGARIRITGD